MLRRLIRSAIVFAAVVLAYRVYLHLAVPVLEPPVVRAKRTPVSDKDREIAGLSVDRYQRFLANYFPAGHWSLVKPCIVIESGPVMLVLSDYERHDNGQIDLEQCAVLLLPTPRQEGLPAPRDAIVLEAGQGAKLAFDDHFDPSRGRIGRLVKGEFPGTIIIRSDMREPGPHDDLLVTTRDLRMNESVIMTDAEVNVRLGENVGGGKRLEIRLVKDPHAQFKKNGLQIAGVQSLEIFEQVRLSLKMDGLDLLSDETKGLRTVQATPGAPTKTVEHQVRLVSDEGPALGAASGETPEVDIQWEPVATKNELKKESAAPGPGTAGLAATVAVPKPIKPPLEVTCSGPFAFDFLNYKATFLRDVEISQLSLTGPSDQLSCQELNIYFAPLDERGKPIESLDEPDISRRQRADMRRLEPSMLEAIGNPVVVVSPTREAEARGQRLRLMLRQRRLKLDGGRVMLAYGPNEIHAPLLQYEHPAPDSPSQVGKLWIAGPGWMRAVPKNDQPNETVEARWERVEGAEYSVRLAHKDNQPVLSIIGQPRIVAAGLADVSANQMHVYLQEVPSDGDGPALEIGSSKGNSQRMAILPERVAATGRVEIKSPQLTGRTEELYAWFQSIAQPAANVVISATGRPPVDEQTSQNSPPPTATYDIGAAKIQLQLALAGRRAIPKNLSCDGQVVFREASAVAGGEEPMIVRGEQVRVETIDEGARVTVAGGGTGNDVTRGNATIVARGMTLSADTIHLDQKSNRMWIEGPGEADLTVTRDLLGQATASASYPVHIRWRGGLDFDGQAIEIRDDVFAEGPNDWLHTKRLTAKLTRPVTFGEGQHGQQAELSEIACTDGVALQHRTVDANGQQSHDRAQLDTLTINQITGALGGDGPGWVRSVHFGQSAAAFADPALAPPRPQNPQLNFLRVDFLRGIAGNLKSRDLRFEGQVRAIYGPVDAWEQELLANDAGGLPEGAVTLESESLQINEDPHAHRIAAAQPGGAKAGPFELKAQGNVRIEGGTAEQGDFTAIAYTASYNQDKDVFVLQGNAQAPAALHLKSKDGTNAAPSFGTITYYRKTGRVTASDLKPSTILFPGQPAR
jgi:lipopolysaccharide export system protein LptA